MLTLYEVTEQQTFNTRLEKLFGLHPGNNQPRFRMSFSDSETIKRYGEFNDFLEGTEIFLRTVTEIRETPKYPWLDGQWIVERLIPNIYKDIMEGNYLYECMWAFPKGLPINYRAAELVITAFFKRLDGQDDVEQTLVPKTEKEMTWLQGRQLLRRKQEIRDSIETTPLQLMLNDKSATALTVDSPNLAARKEKEKEK